METELKPCPFCGSKAVLKTKEMHIGTVWYVIKCFECGAEIKSKPFSAFEEVEIVEAVNEYNALDEKWNRREDNDTR